MAPGSFEILDAERGGKSLFTQSSRPLTRRLISGVGPHGRACGGSYSSDTICGMKVAISLPDPVFAAAEQLAKELRVPRSQLYAEAIAQYLDRRGSAAITAKLNNVYSEQQSEVPAEFASAQLVVVRNEAW